MELTSNNISIAIENRFNFIINKINLLRNDITFDEILNNNNSRTKLDLYKYYKQATVGDCYVEQPSTENMDEYRKWSSWNEAKNVNKIDAMTSYINIYELYLARINEIRINQLENKIEMLLNANTSNIIL